MKVPENPQNVYKINVSNCHTGFSNLPEVGEITADT